MDLYRLRRSQTVQRVGGSSRCGGRSGRLPRASASSITSQTPFWVVSPIELTPHGIETLLAHFAAIGLDGSGEKEVIHEAWPRRPNSGGLAAGAL